MKTVLRLLVAIFCITLVVDQALTISRSADANRVPYSPFPVEMYGTSWCPYCEKARWYMHGRGIEYVEYDIEKDAAANLRYEAFRDKSKGVPLFVIDGQVLQGFNQQRLHEAFKAMRQ